MRAPGGPGGPGGPGAPYTGLIPGFSNRDRAKLVGEGTLALLDDGFIQSVGRSRVRAWPRREAGSTDEGPEVLHELVLDLDGPDALGHVHDEEQV